jgi:hypothetical protein
MAPVTADSRSVKPPEQIDGKTGPDEGQRDAVRQQLRVEIDEGQRDQRPDENQCADQLQRRTERDGTGGAEQSGKQFDQRIAHADRGAAGAAAATEHEP